MESKARHVYSMVLVMWGKGKCETCGDSSLIFELLQWWRVELLKTCATYQCSGGALEQGDCGDRLDHTPTAVQDDLQVEGSTAQLLLLDL